MVLAVEMNSRLFLTSRITVDVLHPIIAAISRKLLWNAKTFSITHLLVKLRCWNFMVPLFRHFGHLNYTTFHADLIATFWYCQYSFTHFTQKFWAAVQWNKYPLCYAAWIFIPLRRPPIRPSYPSNICGASLPEAFRLSTSISACVIPITHVVAPDHCFQLLCRVIRTSSAAAVKQFVLHSCNQPTNAFAAGVVMTSASGAVHALLYSIFA